MKRGGRPARPITLHKVTMRCKAVVRGSGIIKAEVKNRNERMVSIVSGDNARPLSYMMEHLGLLGSLIRGWGTAPPCSVCFVLRRLRTRFVKSRSTFWAVLALVSRNSQPNSLASCIPSSRVTSRSSCLSALLPTSMNIGFWRLTLNMDCRKTSRRSKVAREAIEYTRINPWPSRTH